MTRRRAHTALFASITAVTTGCDGGVQSALNPAGPAAEAIADLWWLMLALGGAVFVAVLVLTALAVSRRKEDRPPLGSTRFVVVAGLTVPAVILVVVLIISLRTTVALRMPEAAVTVEVVGYRWWWEVRYPEQGIVTANEIRVPAGQPVRLLLRTGDVIHSLWVPRLHGKMDLLPEVTNTFWFQADEPGVFRGQCAEFCGVQHARMALVVVAEPPDAFSAWLADQAEPAAEPDTPARQLGYQTFFEAGCDNCHMIRGTPAAGGGDAGPDLTHFGSRLTLGAATRDNTAGHLAGWISNPQALKPGNLMPPTHLPPERLHALVAYLESLQ